MKASLLAVARGRCIAIRFSKTVEFIKEVLPGNYDPITGEFKDGTTVSEIKPCRIYDLGAEKKVAIYGRTDFKAYVVIHQGEVIRCKTVRIKDGEKSLPFFVLEARQVRGKASYIVSEVRSGEG